MVKEKKEKVETVQVKIDKDLHSELKHLALVSNLTLQDFIRKSIWNSFQYELDYLASQGMPKPSLTSKDPYMRVLASVVNSMEKKR